MIRGKIYRNDRRLKRELLDVGFQEFDHELVWFDPSRGLEGMAATGAYFEAKSGVLCEEYRIKEES